MTDFKCCFLTIQLLLYTFHSHFLFVTHTSILLLLLLFFSSLISQILVTPPLMSSFTPFSFLVMTPNMEHKLVSQLENLEANLLFSFVNCCHLLREWLRKASLNIPDSTYMLPLHRFVANKQKRWRTTDFYTQHWLCWGDSVLYGPLNILTV